MWNQYAATKNDKAAPGAITSGASTGPGGWHPTILYLVGLIIAEIVAVAVLTRHLLKK